eukprot:5655103-Pyramimonas_sp.AAC.1
MPLRSLAHVLISDRGAMEDYQLRCCTAVEVLALTLALDQHALAIRTAMQSAWKELLNTSVRKPRRPWISQSTLDRFTERDQ